jgi:hypothetical protein
VVERIVTFRELAVLDRERDVEVRGVQQRRAEAVDLEVEPEQLGRGGGLAEAGDPALDQDVAADDVARADAQDLGQLVEP